MQAASSVGGAVLLFLVLINAHAATAADSDLLLNIRTAWGLAGQWPGTCPGDCDRPSGGWPGTTWNLGSLTRLIVDAGVVTLGSSSWPPELWQLPSLHTLSLQRQAMACPPWNLLLNLPSLKYLYLRNAIIGCSIPSFANLTNLLELGLQGNLINGPWPSDLNTRTSLVGVYLDGNRFGNPLTLDLSASRSTLTNFWMGFDLPNPPNPKSIPYPAWASNLTAITEFGIINMFNGTFVCPVNLARMRTLWVSDNAFDGQPFPVCLAPGPCSLEQYTIQYSNMKGNFPTELFACPNLTSLDLSSSDFNGSFLPSNIDTWQALKTLRILDANISGNLPTQLGNISSLQTISFSRSRFRGTLPTQLGKLASLEVLEVDGTSMNGPLPEELAFATKLRNLDLSGTSIQGPLPGWIAVSAANVTVTSMSALSDCPATSATPFFQTGTGATRLPGGGFIITSAPLVLCYPCAMPRPATNAACYLGRWTVPSVTVVPSTPLNASVPIIINGNLTVPAGSAVQIVYTGNGTAPIVTVNGTATLGGTLEITLQQTPNSGSITVIQADTIVGNFTSIVIPQRAANGCTYATSQQTQGATLSVLFVAPETCAPASSKSGKRTTIIIAVTVAVGVLLIAVVIAAFMFACRKGHCTCLTRAADDEGVLSM